MIKIRENIPLAPYTIYKIGGLARFFVEITGIEDLCEAAVFAREKGLKHVMLGLGSNVLISDNGFDGLVMRMTGSGIQIEGKRMIVDAGVMMARAVMESGKAALHGFEWGIGVPGTIGGSIRGNAGCFGGEMKDIVESVEVFNFPTATSYKLQATNCSFGYRNSIFKTHPEWIVISTVLQLHIGSRQMIQEEIGRIAQERVIKQDIGTKSCGCIFKNVPLPPDNHRREKLYTQFSELAVFRGRSTIPAAFLIDRCGLKGRCVGSIHISDKHANFFINQGGGRSKDVLALIAVAKEEVKKRYGIDLEEEIHLIGF